jgi:hypothetical protein
VNMSVSPLPGSLRVQIEPLSRPEIDNWLVQTEAAVSKSVSAVRVGHVDFFATPSATR